MEMYGDGFMRIDKIINNNIVGAYDADGKEIVVMGRGLGFKMKKGQTIPEEKIEKIFRMDNQKSFDEFESLVTDIPIEHIQVSSDIITYAMENLGKKINQNIYIALTDHISFAIERYKKGLDFSNPLLWDVKRFYPNEYKIGEYGVKLINSRMGVKLLEDEAASIALHIVNAEYNTSANEIVNITEIVKNILDIIKNFFKIKIDEESLHYERFVTHIIYLIQRVSKNELLNDDDDGYRKMMWKLYPDDYDCSRKVGSYIETKLKHKLTEEELLYLTVYIRRVRIYENKKQNITVQ